MSLDALRKARTRIALYGWTQGMNQDELGRTCVEGALLSTGHPGAEQRWAAYCLVHALGDRNVIGWNDAPGRTKEEVLALFDRAIALAEQAADVELVTR